jgi:hypothetical protein
MKWHSRWLGGISSSSDKIFLGETPEEEEETEAKSHCFPKGWHV